MNLIFTRLRSKTLFFVDASAYAAGSFFVALYAAGACSFCYSSGFGTIFAMFEFVFLLTPARTPQAIFCYKNMFFGKFSKYMKGT